MNWWNERFINRRDYILDHLQELSITSDELLVVMLIDFMNEHHISLTHGALASKMKKNADEIDDLLSKLSAKGYMNLEFKDGQVNFVIDGIFEGADDKAMAFDQSLFDMFETEFGRPLSQQELQLMGDWLNEYDQKLIGYALREALTYDKKSFQYIDRILIEWKRRGFCADEYEEGKR